jgi:hypothetical protein
LKGAAINPTVEEKSAKILFVIGMCFYCRGCL